METVKDKVVLITGSSSGIGAAAAVLFAKFGSKVVLHGRNQQNLDKVKDSCIEQGLTQDQVLAVTGEITKDEDLARMVEATIAKFGTLNILVNNAAAGFPGTLQEVSLDYVDEAYRTNLRSNICLTKLALPYLKKSKGSIVNVSSVLSDRPAPRVACYSIMKAALEMVTKDLALELVSDGVRVNSVRPAYVRTPIHEKVAKHEDAEALEEYYRNAGKLHPIGRVGEAEEVAQAIVFLASEASSFTTGANLVLDGGVTHTMTIA